MRLLPVLLLISCAATAGEMPRFSMGHDHMARLGAAGCDWSFVQDNLAVCQLQINAVAYLSPQEELRGLVKILRRKNIAIAVECAYFDRRSTMEDFSGPNPKGIHDVPRKVLEPGVGRETARLEIAKLAPLFAAGGTPDRIVMDGPFRRLMEPNGDRAAGIPLTDAVKEIIAYMRTWLETYPEIKFTCITNFPNWAWKDYPAYRADKKGHGDWYPCIRPLVAATKAAQLPLTAIRADNPYEYAQGMIPVPWNAKGVDWMARLRDLERYAEGEGLDFEMTLNSSYGGMASAQGFYRDTLKFLGAYRESGGTPSLYMIHTWYPFPKKLCPEDEPYTMTNLVKAVMEDCRGEVGAALARELARPRPKVAHSVLDMAPPTGEGGNRHPDFPGTGTWSYWTATGVDSPVELGPGKVRYRPMAWNGKTVPGRGYEGKGTRITLDHVERTEMVPQRGGTPVLRWTSGITGTVRVSGTWWMSAPGNMNLVIFAKGKPIVERRNYTETRNPGFAFDEAVEVEPGDTIEFWADANTDPRHDAARLRATIAEW